MSSNVYQRIPNAIRSDRLKRNVRVAPSQIARSCASVGVRGQISFSLLIDNAHRTAEEYRTSPAVPSPLMFSCDSGLRAVFSARCLRLFGRDDFNAAHISLVAPPLQQPCEIGKVPTRLLARLALLLGDPHDRDLRRRQVGRWRGRHCASRQPCRSLSRSIRQTVSSQLVRLARIQFRPSAPPCSTRVCWPHPHDQE
jgi:hypothetical protein